MFDTVRPGCDTHPEDPPPDAIGPVTSIGDAALLLDGMAVTGIASADERLAYASLADPGCA